MSDLFGNHIVFPRDGSFLNAIPSEYCESYYVAVFGVISIEDCLINNLRSQDIDV